MLRLIRAAAALLLVLAPAAAQAEERILSYLSDVQVQKDSSLQVTETIDVRAERVNINHGIYRDFPTRYRGRNGSQVRVGFTFEGATLDGMPVPATTASVSNGVRIKIGDPDKYVDVGDHRRVGHLVGRPLPLERHLERAGLAAELARQRQALTERRIAELPGLAFARVLAGTERELARVVEADLAHARLALLRRPRRDDVYGWDLVLLD